MINYQILASRFFYVVCYVLGFFNINSILLHKNISDVYGCNSWQDGSSNFYQEAQFEFTTACSGSHTCGQPGTSDTLIAVTSDNILQQLSDCRGEHYEMHDLLQQCMIQKESETFVRAKISNLSKNSITVPD